MATEVAPRSRLLPGHIAAHRVGWFPGSRLLFAEGHPNPGGLAPVAELPGALAAVIKGMAEVGIEVPQRSSVGPRYSRRGRLAVGFGGIRRLDSAVDLRFDDQAQGLATLAGVAALPLPRYKTRIFRETGGRRIETVAFHGYTGRNLVGRWYDKSIESGTGPRGSWVRPEDQRRFPSGARLPVELVSETNFVREAFVRRFEPLWRASKGVKVGSTVELAGRLGKLVLDGEITARQARTIAGHLLLEAGGVEEEIAPLRSRYRYRALARDHGLVLADGVLEEVEVDLGTVVESALDCGGWGCG